MKLLIETPGLTIAVQDGIIVPASGRSDWTVRLAGGEIRPGLINAHDHLHRNHYGRLGSPPYLSAYDWARDVPARHGGAIAAGRTLPRRQALLHGAWKNLLSGVTHVVHHDPWEEDFDRDFPLHVVRLASGDSLGMTPDFAPPPEGPFALHVAEGIDPRAADEIRTLAARGWLNERLLAVHAVGVDDDGIGRMRASGCAVVWCPTSNQFLFGRSAPVDLLAEGMDVLLGSDSLISGTGSLLDELRAARGIISDARLRDAVGPAAARRLGIACPALTQGRPADLVLLRRPLLEAELADVVLVMAAGKLRVLDPQFAAALAPDSGRIIDDGGVERWISGPL